MGQMKCECGREGEVVRGKQAFCRMHFIEHFEKRVKKALKERELLKGERVLVVGSLAAYLFKKFVFVPLEAEFSDSVKDGCYAVVIEWTMDDECVEFLKQFAGDLKFNEDKNIVKALKYVSDEDCVEYAALKGVEFVAREKDKNWSDFLDKFKDKPEMKYNLLRNALEMKNVIKGLVK